MLNLDSDFLHVFNASTDDIERPESFTFPFYYRPHPLVKLAAAQIQKHLQEQNEWHHNFGIDENKDGLVIGKMFGVMVVKNKKGDLRFLAAFSGKLADCNDIKGFVPPIFDMLREGQFYKVGEAEVNKINRTIEQIENDPKYLKALEGFNTATSNGEHEISTAKKKFNAGRKERRKIRDKAKVELSESDYNELHSAHRRASLRQQHDIKALNETWAGTIKLAQQELDHFEHELTRLKKDRKQRSNQLQHELFDQYHFLNKKGQSKSVIDIFNAASIDIPPSGAGDCAAPKLLQYAYKHHLEPICMGEFWWGQGPKSEVRKHGFFYPSCRGKCEPILGHMLEGLNVDSNPMLVNMAEGKEVDVLYEDDHLAIINKPAEFLSVPGKSVSDSVYLRMRLRYPDATGPLIVHRLDMSTSGIMIIAKTKDSHAFIQKEFLRKRVEKRYVAVLDGVLEIDEGEIDLPLRVDLNDRPRQLVCYLHGKKAQTRFEVVSKNLKETRVFFYPLTGRTHQLRVHAAYKGGLNMPIKGDDLYGEVSDRLHLHAQHIRFRHPENRRYIEFECISDF